MVVLHSCCIFIRIIYDKIDKDQNGEISEEELTSWIRHVQKRYILSDTDRQWRDHVPEEEDNTMLKWDVYMDKTYGHIDGTFAIVILSICCEYVAYMFMCAFVCVLHCFGTL